MAISIFYTELRGLAFCWGGLSEAGFAGVIGIFGMVGGGKMLWGVLLRGTDGLAQTGVTIGIDGNRAPTRGAPTGWCDRVVTSVSLESQARK